MRRAAFQGGKIKMADSVLIVVNPDGTARAEIGSVSRIFPDLASAVEWAEEVLHNIRTKGGFRGN